MSVGEALAAEIGKRTREDSIVSDLTYDLRSGEPDFVDKMIATTYGNMALEAMLKGQSGTMAALVRRMLHHGADSRSEARPAQGRRGEHVQHGSLPAQLRQQERHADLPHASLNEMVRSAGPIVPTPRSIREFFNRAAADEEHYPSTIDPRIFHVKLVLEHLGDLAGKRVADVGCGKGRFARVVQERNPTATIYALDLAEAMLAHVPARAHRCAATMTALPLATASCDGAYATESLEHAVDIPAAVCRIVPHRETRRAHRHHR